jgi:arabinofuranan 3-O-arabinosyltransferase
LTLRLPKRREVDALQFVVDRSLAASPPRSVRVLFDGHDAVRRQVDSVGRIGFPARRVKQITLQFIDTTAVQSVEAASGYRSVLPVGVSEVLLEGAEDLVRRSDPGRTVEALCGFGPSLTIDGATLTTEVSGTARQVLRGEPLDWRVCGGRHRVELRAGRHVVDAPSTAEFVPYELALTRSSSRTQPTRGFTDRAGTIGVPTRTDDALLVVDHNFNRGWRATTATGTVLQPVRVNGWQQGYVVPAGAAVSVREAYTPGTWYRWLLALGFAALLGLVVVSVYWRGLGRPEPPLAAGEDRGALRRTLPSVVLVVVAGVPALVALVGAEVVLRLAPRWVPRWMPRWVPWLVLGLGAAAGVVVAARPWPDGAAGVNSAAVQVLVVTAFAVVVRRDSWRRPQRMIGRSTSE